MKRTTVLICLAAVLTLLVVPASAIAKEPPNGKYDCTIGNILFGDLTIKSSTKYKRYGKSGTYKAGSKKVKFKDGRRGYRLTFKSGYLKGFKARWYKGNDGIYEIALRNPEDDFESIYCDKWKK